MSKAMIAALKTAEVEDGVIRLSNQFRDMIVSELETLELLKEQEPVEPRYVMICDNRIPLCGNCDGYLITLYHYCPKCGRAVKWDG